MINSDDIILVRGRSECSPLMYEHLTKMNIDFKDYIKRDIVTNLVNYLMEQNLVDFKITDITKDGTIIYDAYIHIVHPNKAV